MTRLPRRFSSPRNACIRMVCSHHLRTSGCSELSRKKIQITSTIVTVSPPETGRSCVHQFNTVCHARLRRPAAGRSSVPFDSCPGLMGLSSRLGSSAGASVAGGGDGLGLQRLGEDFFGSLHRYKGQLLAQLDRKSTRLNSSHANISYAVF